MYLGDGKTLETVHSPTQTLTAEEGGGPVLGPERGEEAVPRCPKTPTCCDRPQHPAAWRERWRGAGDRIDTLLDAMSASWYGRPGAGRTTGR